MISLYLTTITGGLARYLQRITTHSGRHMVVTWRPPSAFNLDFKYRWSPIIQKTSPMIRMKSHLLWVRLVHPDDRPSSRQKTRPGWQKDSISYHFISKKADSVNSWPSCTCWAGGSHGPWTWAQKWTPTPPPPRLQNACKHFFRFQTFCLDLNVF